NLLNLAPESISCGANFFELGGHSLLAVKLLSLIEVQFEKTCDLSSLFENTTVQTQASLLNALEQGLKNNPLLQTVTAGTTAPQAGVIFIPGVASTSRDFVDIVEYLAQGVTNTEIGIFRHKGQIAGESYFKTIDENVAAFSKCIANRPYTRITLVGHSYGGALALSLAESLKAKGYQIDLVMLDTYFEQRTRLASSKDFTLRSKCSDELTLPGHLHDLYNHQVHLFEEFKPQRRTLYPVTVVFACDSPIERGDYVEYLHEQLSDRQIRTTSVEGEHFSMLRGKSAKLVSEIIVRTTNNIE
ncbi:thioesterase domain-containing protein, partial [Pseudoalteromonas sp. NJ631]|uniref:thioesterase domain-containing protein n=1 Tax=Pseudoalteromonas sp. NJ631 TaxID=493915 RepID=UPI000474D6D0